MAAFILPFVKGWGCGTHLHKLFSFHWGPDTLAAEKASSRYSDGWGQMDGWIVLIRWQKFGCKSKISQAGEHRFCLICELCAFALCFQSHFSFTFCCLAPTACQLCTLKIIFRGIQCLYMWCQRALKKPHVLRQWHNPLTSQHRTVHREQVIDASVVFLKVPFSTKYNFSLY